MATSTVRTAEPQSIGGAHPVRRAIALLIIWVAAILSAFGYLMAYSGTPGESSESPSRWPMTSKIHRNVERPTLLMFIHPRCPCTRASLEELSRIVARCRGRAEVHTVVVLPENAPAGWGQTDLYRQAAAIADIIMDVDARGTEARLFHGTTSGYTLLYDADGALLFSGGITGARGHEGDNDGENAVVGWLEKGHAALRAAPVFGCPLFDPGA